MDDWAVKSILTRCGAIATGGHFVYKSGLHGDAYVNKDAIYAHPRDVSALCHALADATRHWGAEAVIGPAIGGAIMSQGVALQLCTLTNREILATFADKTEQAGFTIGRGYDRLIAKRRVLVVEDVLNTGGSVSATIGAARRTGANVVGVAALIDRGGLSAEKLGVERLVTLARYAFEAWTATECPLCAIGRPIEVTLGHGKEYVASLPSELPRRRR